MGAANTESYDLAIIGGGINGAGIARDAAGRGLKVVLVEKGDLGAATSSASSKLVHGGLRYLEYGEFKLVRESLRERERLLQIAPHIISPLQFVLPHVSGMRPAWMIHAGLKLYDHLAPRKHLSPSHKIRLQNYPELSAPLNSRYQTAFTYADCWVDDARLVVLNAKDAAEHGADILTRTTCTGLERQADGWKMELAGSDGDEHNIHARLVVNAAGPWVDEVAAMSGVQPRGQARLVKGSHIVVPRIHEGDHAYILQMPDKRIIFLLPFEGKYTLIGTTDIAYEGDPSQVAISAEETAYLLEGANRYLADPLQRQDIVWSYSGVRSLYDDQATSLSAITRDFVLELNDEAAPILSVFGGKITTYRILAEQALAKLAPWLPESAQTPWTGSTPLPGGDVETEDFSALCEAVQKQYPWLPEALATRWLRQYGSCIHRILANTVSLGDLGREVAAGVYECELYYAHTAEWAKTANDFLWRRTKLGLHLDEADRQKIADWFAHGS